MILIPTFARSRLLANAVWCALNQTVRSPILILNDCPEQELICDVPGVRCFNLPHSPSIGLKRNLMLDLASDYERATWLDDDDWLLPWHMEAMPTADAIARPSHAFWKCSDELPRIIDAPAIVMSMPVKGARFPDLCVGEDQAISSSAPVFRSLTGYVYRWGNGVHHISGGNVAGFLPDAQQRLDSGSEPRGRCYIYPTPPAGWTSTLREALSLRQAWTP